MQMILKDLECFQKMVDYLVKKYYYLNKAKHLNQLQYINLKIKLIKINK
jgi:hypothetical protein